MALPDLTGQNIENTYNRVVQTDGTFFYDGTGSLLNLGGSIDTGSFATTGSNIFRGSQTISGSGIQVPLQVISGSTTLFHISSSNNVGFNQSASATTHVQFKSPYNSNIVEINTSANGQYGVRTDGIIKANNFYFYNTTGTIANASGVTLLGFSAANNVGVATISPQRRLHVDASGSASTDTPLALTSTDANQRVGILFASSSLASGRQHKLLHRVNGPIVEWLLNSNAGETAIWRFQPQDNTNYSLNILTPYNGGTTYVTTGLSQSLFSLGAGSQNAQHLNISSSGFVGIGTTTPTATLDVSGSVRITNNAVITGSLLVTQGANVILSTGTSTLSRLGVTSVDWRSRTLNNSDGNVVVDWESYRMYDVSGSNSIDWYSRVLWDATEGGSVESIDYGARRLHNSTGDVVLDWNTGQLTGTASYATQALSASYAPGTPAFPFVGSAQITGSLSVSGSVTINNVDIQSTIVAMAIALG